MDALIIKPKWADMILNGSKKWEIRGRRTEKRGTIGIIKSRSGKVYGQVDLVGCIPLTMYDWANNKDKHLVDYADIDYDTPYAWILANPVIFPEPVPYQHPQGAVIWVKLPDTIVSRKCEICGGTKSYELEQCGIVTPVACTYCDDDGNWLGIGDKA